MSGRTLGDHALSEAVMQLEQLMTTGGGWQTRRRHLSSAKLLITGRITTMDSGSACGLSPERQAEFSQLLVLYNTGIQRMAKDLLRQVVSRYLARETATIQCCTASRRWPWRCPTPWLKRLETPGRPAGSPLAVEPGTRSAYSQCAHQRDSESRPTFCPRGKVGWRRRRRISDAACRDEQAAAALQKTLMLDAPASSGMVNYASLRKNED